MNRAWNLNVIIFCLGVISYYSCYCFQTSRTFAKIEQKKNTTTIAKLNAKYGIQFDR